MILDQAETALATLGPRPEDEATAFAKEHVKPDMLVVNRSFRQQASGAGPAKYQRSLLLLVVVR